VLLQNKEDKNVAVLISLNSRELGYLPHIHDKYIYRKLEMVYKPLKYGKPYPRPTYTN